VADAVPADPPNGTERSPARNRCRATLSCWGLRIRTSWWTTGC